MKVIIVMAASLNGKITRGEDNNIYSWTSKEDAKLFFSLIAKNNLIVMGRKTYEAAQKYIKLQKGKLRIVLTHNPKRYLTERVAGCLEFSSETPQKLAHRLEQEGHKKMLVVGGGAVNGLFLKAALVDEIWLTIEPKIFGTGKPLVGNRELDVALRLKSVRRLNKQGTLHLRYSVKSNIEI
ncbi:MAG: dihydrofolate reductase family protein [bacterium]|nr:dihydrofolate reductase family protein [bacterium]